uniref:Pentacotripeptide-repeat region of PRORP domain-containing protein n=1 Tax=Glycine max TaxID=3847 RepID=A0A0R0J2I6_SOYBN
MLSHSFHSFHSPPQQSFENVDDALFQFNRMLCMRHTPPIIQFGQILGSIMKMKHYPTVVFLSHWLELKKIQSGLFTLNILLFLPFGSNQLGFLCVIQDPQIGLSAPYHNLLTTLIKGLCPKGQVKKALHFHDKVLAQGFQLNQLKKATGLLNEMVLKTININVRTYTILVDALCKEGKMEGAKNVLAVTLKACLKPNIRRVDEAINLYKEMHQKNVAPDIVTYTSLIDGLCKSDSLCKSSQLDKAIALFNKMKDNGIQPDMYTLNILLHGLCKGKRLKNAQGLFQDLLDKGYHLNVYIYTVMINGLCKEGLIDEAFALWSNMEDSELHL